MASTVDACRHGRSGPLWWWFMIRDWFLLPLGGDVLCCVVWGLLARHLGWTTTTKSEAKSMARRCPAGRLALCSTLMTTSKTKPEIIYCGAPPFPSVGHSFCHKLPNE
jgi:hypothetical protein